MEYNIRIWDRRVCSCCKCGLFTAVLASFPPSPFPLSRSAGAVVVRQRLQLLPLTEDSARRAGHGHHITPASWLGTIHSKAGSFWCHVIVHLPSVKRSAQHLDCIHLHLLRFFQEFVCAVPLDMAVLKLVDQVIIAFGFFLRRFSKFFRNCWYKNVYCMLFLLN